MKKQPSTYQPNEDTLMWRNHREAIKRRHEAWYQQNLDILRASGVPFTLANGGIVALFREPGKPKVDFYPHTGRWRAPLRHKGTFRGQAKAFLAWYAKQSEELE